MDTSILQSLWKRVMPIVAAVILLLGSSILTGCSEEPVYSVPDTTTCYGIFNVCD
jgi:hypothetical protein